MGKEIVIYTGFGHINAILERAGEGDAWINTTDGYCYGRLDFNKCKLIARRKEIVPGIRAYDLVVKEVD